MKEGTDRYSVQIVRGAILTLEQHNEGRRLHDTGIKRKYKIKVGDCTR